jgi:hypothetical protein
MSITSVMREVKAATKGGSPMQPEKITQAEARKILKEADKNGITAGEGKVLVDTFELPRGAFTEAVGEGPSYYLTEAATKTFEKFFADKGLPGGANAEAMKQNVEVVLQNVGANLNQYKMTGTPNLKHLVAVHMLDRAALVGGPMRTAYIDVAKKTFILQSQPMNPMVPSSFYGPFGLAVEPDC